MSQQRRSLSRRQFMHRSAAATATAAGVAAASPALAQQSAAVAPPSVTPEQQAEIEKTRSFNPEMEYRRLGKTGLWVSAVCIGGHWKRVDKILGTTAGFGSCEGDVQAESNEMVAFRKNRRDVISRCLEVGINLIDFAGSAEPGVYAEAIKGRRDQIYVAWSMGGVELRHPEHRNAQKLVEIFQPGFEQTGLEYLDQLLCVAMQDEVDEMVEALQIAKQKGLCRFTGFSTHDRRWASMLIETYPDLMQMCCTPYTARSKELKKDSFFDKVRQYDVGVLGIKPFASNAVFQGDGTPTGEHVEADNQTARLTVRYILMNPAITAPIPGLASPQQVDNMALAVKERREMDLAVRSDSPAGVMPPTDQQTLAAATERMWEDLGPGYRWLNHWRYV